MAALEFISLGKKDYKETLALQMELRRRRQEGVISDTILTVEHPRVITQGRRPAAEDYRISPEQLRRKGIAVQAVNRGGKLTYHGPGQLVAYFIVSLTKRGWSVPRFVDAVEESAIGTLRALGLRGERRPGCPGVWVEDRKIVSIGLSVDRGVSMHGFAMNIHPDLADFQWIVSCGMPECRMTSVLKETGREFPLELVENHFCQSARRVFSKQDSGSQMKTEAG